MFRVLKFDILFSFYKFCIHPIGPIKFLVRWIFYFLTQCNKFYKKNWTWTENLRAVNSRELFFFQKNYLSMNFIKFVTLLFHSISLWMSQSGIFRYCRWKIRSKIELVFNQNTKLNWKLKKRLWSSFFNYHESFTTVSKVILFLTLF